MKSYKLFAVLALAACALGAQAQTLKTLKIATGGAGNTYSTMFKELNNVCASEVPMIEQNTSGSNENVELLTGNQINGAWVQSDVLYFLARTQEMGNIKTLLALHPEEVHVVARVDSGLKTGGVMGVGGKAVVFNDISNLGNFKVGAAGGSETTAQVIRLQSEIPYNVVRFGSNADALAALTANQIQAVVMVGGSPLKDVANLGPDFKMLSIPEAVQAKLKGVYRGARVSYPKMGAAGVQTVATDALFVTREYSTEAMRFTLGKFRACALAKLPELQETTGTHKKWQAVDAANHGKWAWYTLPEVSPAVATANAATPVAAAPAEAAVPAKPLPKKK